MLDEVNLTVNGINDYKGAMRIVNGNLFILSDKELYVCNLNQANLLKKLNMYKNNRKRLYQGSG